MDEEYENRLFEIKSRFLRDVPHPRLIRKGMEQARAMAGDAIQQFETSSVPEQANLSAFLTQTIEELLKLKLAITRAATAQELYAGLNSLYVTQMALLQKLASYLPVWANYPDKELKISEPVDGYPVWRFINAKGLSEDEIKPYICKSLENGIPAADNVLLIACLRSRKILANE